MAETSQPRPAAWTVGDLRRAIADIPDDTLLIVNLADEPGGDSIDTQVVISAGFGQVDRGDGRGLIRTAEFALECEFPGGPRAGRGSPLSGVGGLSPAMRASDPPSHDGPGADGRGTAQLTAREIQILARLYEDNADVDPDAQR
jgi:Family of unknown function (DUF6225)